MFVNTTAQEVSCGHQFADGSACGTISQNDGLDGSGIFVGEKVFCDECAIENENNEHSDNMHDMMSGY
jgi:hypothetical protein